MPRKEELTFLYSNFDIKERKNTKKTITIEKKKMQRKEGAYFYCLLLLKQKREKKCKERRELTFLLSLLQLG
jgi:hypothetical protein